MELEQLFAKWLETVKRHDFKEADDLYRKIVALNPLQREINYPMGVWYKELGLNEEAMAAFKRALKSDPSIKADIYYYLGNIKKNLHDFPQAIVYYQKALEVEGEFFEAWFNLGKVYSMLGENERALSHYQKALQLNPQDVDTYVNLAVEFSNLGLKEKALAIYEKALEIQGDSYLVYSNMGVEYAELGEFKKAMEYHKKSLELNSFYGDGWYNLACTYALAGDFHNALISLEKAFRLDKENVFYAQNDPDFSELKKSQDFQLLLQDYT